MNTPPNFKNNRVYLYQDYQEMQEMNNYIINKKAEKMEEMIDKIFTGIFYIIVILLGVGVVPVFLSVMVN